MKGVTACAFLLVCPALAWAQGWSAPQQEIIEQIRRCNDGWVASIAKKRFELFESVCPSTDQAVFWYPGGAPPARYSGQQGVWADSSTRYRALSWKDLQAVTVQIDGDVAFIYHTVTWTLEPHTGEPIEAPSRRLTVLQRRNGRWLLAGGTISPP